MNDVNAELNARITAAQMGLICNACFVAHIVLIGFPPKIVCVCALFPFHWGPGGGEKKIELHKSRGKLLARERIGALLDAGYVRSTTYAQFHFVSRHSYRFSYVYSFCGAHHPRRL